MTLLQSQILAPYHSSPPPWVLSWSLSAAKPPIILKMLRTLVCLCCMLHLPYKCSLWFWWACIGRNTVQWKCHRGGKGDQNKGNNFEKELLTLGVFSLKMIQLRGGTMQAYKRDWVQSRISDQLSSTLSNMRAGDLSEVHVVQSQSKRREMVLHTLCC